MENILDIFDKILICELFFIIVNLLFIFLFIINLLFIYSLINILDCTYLLVYDRFSKINMFYDLV